MSRTLKTFALASAVALGAATATAAEPSYYDGGITEGHYYDGGAVAGALAEEHLSKFDELDFDVFSNQDWARFHESHDKDIVVTWPDGHSTVGLGIHIEDLKKLFIHAPDTEIKVHPVRIASKDWTAVIGVMTGTFTRPMPIGDGKFIEPTGKRFEIRMATIAFWQNGRMVHEWLFWDNATYAAQLGLGG